MCGFTLFKFELFKYEYSNKCAIRLNTDWNQIFGTALLLMVLFIEILHYAVTVCASSDGIFHVYRTKVLLYVGGECKAAEYWYL